MTDRLDWMVDELQDKHPSQPFNPDLANAFFRAGMIEARGRGVERILEACRLGHESHLMSQMPIPIQLHVVRQLLAPRLFFALALIAGWAAGGFSNGARGQSAPVADEVLRCQFIEEELICVKVKVFGEEALFAIDTGSSITALDLRFQNRLGKPLPGNPLARTPTGAISRTHYRAPEIKMVSGDSELDVSLPFVATVDLTSVLAVTDQPIAGFIGMDFLKKHVLRVNIDEGYAALVHATRDTSAEMKHIAFDKLDLPTVRLRISDDQFHETILDTGNCNQSLDLALPLFRKLKQKGRILVDGGLVVSNASGFSDSQRGILDHAELGDVLLRNITVSSSQLNLMGLTFLSDLTPNSTFRIGKPIFVRESACTTRLEKICPTSA